MKQFRRFLLISLIAFAIGAGFGPWVYRPPVALQLTPPGLAEFVKFLREVRFGQLQLERLYFLLPLAVASFGTPLIAVNARLGLNWTLNTFLRLTVIPMALSLLSPIWAPERLLNDEFRLQTMVAGAAIGFTVIAFIFKKVPLPLVVLLMATTAIAATWLALEQFFLANAAIEAAYNGSVWLGWGGWLTVLGAAGLVVSAVWSWFVWREA